MASSNRARFPRLLFGLAALTLAACSSGDDNETTADADDTTTTADTAEAEADDPAADERAEADGSATDEADNDGATNADETAGDTETLFPDVVDATADLSGDGTWNVSATLSSPYDSADRYADAWRVVGADGTVYGIRELAHDHAGEQPFTRSLSGVEIPNGEAEVTIEGRDQVSGWGGETVTISLER